MATQPNENLRIWKAVEKTDPSHTKKVNQRGGFTAISAHYQVMRATETFGPVGIGWGYTNGDPIFAEGLVIVPVTIWHGDRSNTFGPLYGSAEMRNSKGHLDSDAPKKASTDGLTKGLSQLGFNADVFLGKFDDNKYVRTVEQEFRAAEQAENVVPMDGEKAKREKLDGPYTSKSALWAAYKQFVREVHGCGDLDQLEALLNDPECKALRDQIDRDAPAIAHTGEGMPPEFVPMHAMLAKAKTDLAAAEADSPNYLMAG